MNNKTLLRVVIGGGVLILLLLTAILVIPKPDSGPVACTLEAKLCPDGSSVGRTGPNCEFAACPSASGPAVSASGNMKVYSPVAGQVVTRPLVIVGEGRAFESAFSYRLLTAGVDLLEPSGDKVIAEGHGMLLAPDIGQFGPFSVSLAYPAQTGPATLEVFEYSAKDGSVTNNVRIPVQLSAADQTLVTAYFSNSKADPDSVACDRTYPVARVVPKTTVVARAAIEELLKGPLPVEKQAGYITNLPAGVVLQSVTIKSGVATVDFNSALNQVGGSCRVSAIRSQIEQTLKQFSTVSSVKITVNGNSEEVLQP